jgi:hypothetical protein
MAAAFSMLFAKLVELASWFGKLYVAVFKAAWHLVTDVVCWSLEGLLEVAVSMASKVDTTGIASSIGAWGSLPSEVMNVLGLLGAGEAVGIIVTAIGIRLVLQLIPFTRLGS